MKNLLRNKRAIKFLKHVSNWLRFASAPCTKYSSIFYVNTEIWTMFRTWEWAQMAIGFFCISISFYCYMNFYYFFTHANFEGILQGLIF